MKSLLIDFPGHHDLGFAAHLSIDGKKAVLTTAWFERVANLAMEE